MATRNTVGFILLGIAVVAFIVLSRLMPHPPNVTPLLSLAVFSGALLPRKYAYWLPLLGVIISDVFIGMHSLVLFTWGSFVLIALASSFALKNVSLRSTLLMSVGGATLFFVITNFGVWAEGRMYPATFEGLIQCYYNALPFFRNTLIGALLYSSIFYGAYITIAQTQVREKLLKLNR